MNETINDNNMENPVENTDTEVTGTEMENDAVEEETTEENCEPETRLVRCPGCGEVKEVIITEELIEKIGFIPAAEMTALRTCRCEGSKKLLKEQANRNFKGFVSMTLLNFFEDNKLENISIKTGSGNTAKIKRNKNGELKVETTVQEVF